MSGKSCDEALDRLYEFIDNELPPEELKGIPKAPGSLEEALESLKKDHAFLLKGDVFGKEVVETWIEWKEENELKPSRLRPTAFEFMQYFDA